MTRHVKVQSHSFDLSKSIIYKSKHFSALVSNPRAAATFGGGERIWYKNYSIIQAVRYTYHLLLFCHVGPENQLTITGVALCYKKQGPPRFTASPSISYTMYGSLTVSDQHSASQRRTVDRHFT